MARIMHIENLDYLRGKLEGLLIGHLYANSVNYNKKLISKDFWMECLGDMIDETINKIHKKLEDKND